MIQRLLGFMIKEFRQTLGDPRMLALLFVAPCIQITLFGLALTTETKNVKIAVLLRDRDPMLQSVYRHALASGWFIPAPTESMGDPYQSIRNGTSDAVLLAEAQGLQRGVGRGEGDLQLLLDASNAVRALSVERYVAAILARQQAAGSTAALWFDTRVLYNPSLDSTMFMVPGVMAIIICLTTIIMTSMAIAREKEMGTIETIIAAPVTSSEVILGKTLPYILLGIANVPLIIGVAVTLFHVPLVGSFSLLLLAALVFVCTTVTIGILISTLARTQQQAMMGSFIFLLPAILLSGLMFPIENMPWPLKWIAYVDPLTYFIEMIRNIMLKGGSSDVVMRDVSALLTIAAVIGFIGIKRFKTTL